MAIDFPNSPSTNDTYTVGNKTWIYDGTTWNTYNTTSFIQPGLVLVKTQTIGSAVASVAVTNAFSADYDNYKVVVTGGVSSGAFASLNLTFGATVTGYHRTGFYMIAPGLGRTGIAEVNVSSIVAAGTGTPSSLLMNADIYTPFLAKPTGVKSDTQRQTANSATFWLQGFLDNTTSYTGFTLTVSSGTITGGTIRVYGVRS